MNGGHLTMTMLKYIITKAILPLCGLIFFPRLTLAYVLSTMGNPADKTSGTYFLIMAVITVLAIAGDIIVFPAWRCLQ